MRRVLLSLICLANVAAGQTPFDQLRFRSIGPAALGGRIADVEGVPNDPLTLYVASASGGLWKTTNKGTTWTPLFDQMPVATFGDVAIFAGNPNILYVGTGEQNNRQSTSWGNGVYTSKDAGKSWQHLGLEETRHIGRVVIHPTDPNVVYVAAQGNLWAPSVERGVFKTIDGGRSWSKVLFVDSLTGATDLVMSPADPNTLIAATYQRLRTPWGFNGGGPGSAIYKSTDGGATWRKVTTGIPSGDKGRIGLTIARSDPRVLIALIEHQTASGTYRSEDAGESWTRVNALNPRPMYYSKPVIDPTNANRVWVPGVTVYRSEDGGRTFRTLPTGPTYDVGLKGDHHSFWINPKEPRHAYLGGDGGLHETWDFGETWTRINNIPIGQFYAIDVDNRDPYWIYGGMQDNHSWMGPSQTRHWLGIVNEDWRQIGFGDGMYQRTDPFNPRWIYTAGQNLAIQRFDVETGDRLGLRPLPAPNDSAYRFDWTAPMLASRHTPGTIYVGGNRLFVSKDYGNSWTRSSDLTRQIQRDTLPIMGTLGRNIGLSRYDGESSYSELTTIAESPIDPKVIWVGSDDGLVHVSRDGGVTFTDVTAAIRGVPTGTLVSRVVASSLGAGAAYASFDAHRSGDFAPYVFRTTDFGRSWQRVDGSLPKGMSVRTVYEYPGRPHLVFAGLEFALYFSLDTARTWTRLNAGLPTTRYDDILVHPRTKDLVIGSHGRSIWILDDAAPLADWNATIAKKPVHLFAPRAATLFQFWQDFSYLAHAAYAGENPADGALLTYSLGKDAQRVEITVRTAAGRLVRTLTGPTTGGAVHRVNWDLRYAAPPASGFGGGEEGGVAGALPRPPRTIGERGPFVAPGTFVVTIDADGAKETQRLVVRPDPLLNVTVAQHQIREAFLLQVLDAQRETSDMTQRAFAIRRDLVQADSAKRAAWLRSGVVAKLDTLERLVSRGPAALRGRTYGIAGEYNGSGALQGSLHPPTKTHRDAFAAILADLAVARKRLTELEALTRVVQ